MTNITLIYDSRNFSIIKDNIGLIWLYSDQKPIAFYDNILKKITKKSDLNNKQLTHLGVFKKKIKNNEI